MNKFFSTLKQSVRAFACDEDGAQVVEYALIIAVVSIALVIALSSLAGGATNPFSTFIARVNTCLTGAVGSCV